jgi:hypothetical protein
MPRNYIDIRSITESLMRLTTADRLRTEASSSVESFLPIPPRGLRRCKST